MDDFDRYRERLKKYLVENREQVKKDLDEMRVKSIGNDIQSYLNNLQPKDNTQYCPCKNECLGCNHKDSKCKKLKNWHK
jgi:hypothetical protein